MKVDLTELLRDILTTPAAPPAVEERTAHLDLRDAAPRPPTDTGTGTDVGAGVGKKDLVLRGDQLAALAQLEARLMQQRTAKHTRLTRNTILRVMVDVLLPYTAAMSGDTEDELRASLTAHLADPPPR